MDIAHIKEIIAIFEQSTLTTLTITSAAETISLTKDNVQVVQSLQKQAPDLNDEKLEAVIIEETQNEVVKSPLVGTFYQSESQDAPPFVQVGSYVKKGETLCIIEAMKMMNEIQADKSGVITSVCVQNGELVEYDQVLFQMREQHD